MDKGSESASVVSNGSNVSMIPSGTVASASSSAEGQEAAIEAAKRHTAQQQQQVEARSASHISDMQSAIKRGPFGNSSDQKAALAPIVAHDSNDRALGKRPAIGPPSPPDALASTSKTARRTRQIARELLEGLTCASCRRPFSNPVTLPCGHSTCFSCLSSKLKKLSTSNNGAGPSRLTHVPPRLPLCSMTVPCPVNGCPRSAIGQGLGVWAGYSAAFGPPSPSTSINAGEENDDGRGNGSQDDAGVLPVDGFVVGADNQSLRLGVIPPQPRDKANRFAVSPFPFDESSSESLLLSLRPDVTLAKAIAVLEKFAATPPEPAPPRRPFTEHRARRPLRGYVTSRRHGALASSSSLSHTHAARRLRQMPSNRSLRGTDPYSRPVRTRPGATRIASPFRSMLGGSEADRESGTVDGIKPYDTEDEEDEESSSSSSSRQRFRSQGAAMFRSSSATSALTDDEAAHDQSLCDDEDEDADDDDFGGAFARPDMPLGFGEEHERRRLQRMQLRASTSQSPAPEMVEGDSNRQREEVKPGHIEHEGAFGAADHDQQSGPVLAGQSSTSAVDSKVITPEHLQSDLTDTLECQLCYLLLYQPVTTPCGHTFCRSCFARSLDHSSKCPLCRASMPSYAFFQDHPLNQGLMKLLNSQVGPDLADPDSKDEDSSSIRSHEFPREHLDSLSRLGVFADSSEALSPLDGNEDEADLSYLSFGLRKLYQERAASAEEEERAISNWAPIFVCTVGFPEIPTNLHIFEPRYRLMIRRCMQGSGPARFGMVLPSRNPESPVPGFSEYGIMLEIKTCQMLLDGRSMLETVGWRRFRLLETGSLDGYSTGRVEFVDDLPASQIAAEERLVAENNESIRLRAAQAAERQQRQRGHTEGSVTPPNATEVSTGMTQPEGAHVVPSLTEGNDSPSVILPPLTESSSRDSTPGAILLTEAELVQKCVSFIEVLRTQTVPGLFDRIVASYGPVPQPIEVAKLSWWLGMVLPIDEHAKSTLLPMRTPRQRLEVIAGWIERIQEQWRPHP